MRCLVLCLALSLCRIAEAGVSELPAALDKTVGAGSFDELCVRLAAGQSVRYSFAAGAPMNFNVHWHRGNAVLYPVKRDGVARLEGRFTADQAQIYCLMWTNRGAAEAPLRARVERAE